MRLVYFSPVFAASYAQRPHYTVEAWLRRGVESVLWVNPYPARLPQWQDLQRRPKMHDQGTPLDERVTALNVPSVPIEPLPGGPWLGRRVFWHAAWNRLVAFAARGPWILGVGRPGSLPLEALRSLRPMATFYDAMDNFTEFHEGLARRAMQRHEDALAEEVDLVVASSTFLAGKFRRRGLRVEKVLNGCTPAPLPKRQAQEAPATLGYLGCIGKWFDWPLVLRLAEQLPRTQIDLVGPCVVGPPAVLPSNIRLLPPCAQSETPAHLARFSAGLIPFTRNSLTAAVDPIKYYEYRAAGLPVLSTRFGEMALRGPRDHVHFLDRAEQLAPVVARALRYPPDGEATAQFRHDHNWLRRFDSPDPFRSLFPEKPRARAA